ncbi:carbamoyltransferase [Oleiphilus sp. HI0117]|uniref:carbamoyltransferase family protein n=3 Tax=unclassified Oleiphilus TaxID=2631174 RepID=UPI0007C3F098|nr:carbamoyltransferase [Oleiphilus sp. HI0117]KZZ37652.1 hypothetical protein A3757_10390 [Oleiphilus sp. HI0117]
MYILGISAYYHDSAACLIKGGEIVAAVQEERFTRVKHDSSFPIEAIKYCLQVAQIKPDQIEYVTFYDKPFLKFERLLETYLAFAPKGLRSFATSMPLWVKDKLFQKSTILKELSHVLGCDTEWRDRLLFSEHHLSHAASAFYPSPFDNAAVLTMDGVGEWTTTSLAIGKGNSLEVLKEIHFPHSLGLLYSAFTYYTGFKVNAGEYKVMGLAPYGKPVYVNKIKEHLIDIRDDGSFQLNMAYFDYCTGLTMTNKRFHNLFGGPPRQPESTLTQKEMDLAASIQKVIEDVVIKMARNIASETGQTNLCLAGGVALNCVANGVLIRENIFENVWVQPASGDAGGSVGAALATYYSMLDQPRSVVRGKDSMQGTYLGPEFSSNDIRSKLTDLGASFTELNANEIIEKTASALADGLAIGWMSGRMEFGPRSLGGRSIIADPRSTTMQKNLNLKVKFRESFRPFAPSILREDLESWFNLDCDSPYMLLVADVAETKKLSVKDESEGIEKLKIPRSIIPAVTHVDGSARVQTVHEDTNPKYHALISRFKEITDCPVLVNTSFNVRGEPVVCTPEDAFRCFMGTDLDILVIDNFFLVKSEQDKKLSKSYKDKYELD